MLKSIIAILLPQVCILCGVSEHNKSICTKCAYSMPRSENIGVSWIYSYYKYDNVHMHKIIHSIKYYNKRSLMGDIVKYMINFYAKSIDTYCRFNDISPSHIILVPIPISEQRRRIRGYNQSELLANNILIGASKHFNNLQTLNIIKKTSDTKRLSWSSNISDRAEEIHNTMETIQSHYTKENDNTLYVLIDDVTTTGATLYEAKRALTSAGIDNKYIMAITIAH